MTAPAPWPPGDCRLHTTGWLQTRWEDWYEVWADQGGFHARARADGSMVHRPSGCALNRELEDDFAARRQLHRAHHRAQEVDCR